MHLHMYELEALFDVEQCVSLPRSGKAIDVTTINNIVCLLVLVDWSDSCMKDRWFFLTGFDAPHAQPIVPDGAQYIGKAVSWLLDAKPDHDGEQPGVRLSYKAVNFLVFEIPKEPPEEPPKEWRCHNCGKIIDEGKALFYGEFGCINLPAFCGQDCIGAFRSRPEMPSSIEIKPDPDPDKE